MDFAFTEEQEAIRALAREILENEATPERIREAEASSAWCDRALLARLAEANLLAVAVPEAQGGLGMGFAEAGVLLEELGRAVAPLPGVEAQVATLLVAVHGSETQRAAWLPRVASGEAVLGLALPEATCEAPVLARVSARGAKDGLVLDGVASGVAHAGAAAAVLLPVRGDRGTDVVLLDPEASGVASEAGATSTGQPLATLRLQGVRVGAEAILGGPGGDGAAAAAALRDHVGAGLALLQAGVCGRAIEITAGYVREREQFGTPIGSFQAVQHRLADAYIDHEALRWVAWRAAWRLAAGLPAAREAAVARFWAADAGARIAAACVHLHGGIGSDVDYPIHRHFLWAKAIELRGGSAPEALVWLGRDMARTGPPPDLEAA